MTFRAFSIGFSAALLALACGSSDKNNDNTTPTPVDTTTKPVDVTPVAETCADNPLLAGCQPPAQTVTTPPPGNVAKPPSAGTSEADLAKAAAENVLAANCGQCHGPALTEQQAKAGMNYINDIDKLVSTGKIVPLDSAGSRIVQRMVRGEMPPIDSGLPRVTDADINTVSQYIDNPRFWPDVKTASADCTTKGQVVDFDQLFISVNDDLNKADNKDIPFYRYISLTNRFTAGQCADSLDKDRDGLSKMINMLSIDPVITKLVPVNTDQTLFRLDIRDPQWDRAVSVNGNAFADVWEAIAANNPYAVEFTGQDADRAKADTLTAFPIQFSDQMMDQAVIGNLYYAIIGVDVAQPLSTFVAGLQIDLAQNILDEKQLRAGTTKSRISRQDRLVEQDDIEIRAGSLWQAFDFEDNANQSIFQNPFNFTPGGTEAIFTLPNGMLGFIIADANQAIKEDSDILLDTNQNNFRAITSVSCSNCHATGLIPVVDEVRDIALSNALEIGLNNDQVQELKSIYVSPTEFAKKVTDDSQTFYQRALQQANLPIQGGDPVSSVFLRFDQDMRIEDAAGDLGLLPSTLLDNLDLLNPVLSVLRKGTLDRDDFTALYVDSLCKLSTPLDNVPVQAVCDAAAAAADALIGQ